MDYTRTNKKIIKKGIQDSFTIKSNEGEDPQEICDKLSTQFYKFIMKDPEFTSRKISRGMRGIVTEENRDAIILTLGEIYLDYINKNDNFQNKTDKYVKSILESSGDLDKSMYTILGDRKMIYRMRKSSR